MSSVSSSHNTTKWFQIEALSVKYLLMSNGTYMICNGLKSTCKALEHMYFNFKDVGEHLNHSWVARCGVTHSADSSSQISTTDVSGSLTKRCLHFSKKI